MLNSRWHHLRTDSKKYVKFKKFRFDFNGEPEKVNKWNLFYALTNDRTSLNTDQAAIPLYKYSRESGVCTIFLFESAKICM